MQPNAANSLKFEINGPGVIAGVDNADIKDTEQYIGNKRKVWHGRALVVIRSNHQAGEIKLSVTSNRLVAGTIVVKSIKN
ncbi:hypothetical protein D3C84_1260010 [compost metagenome]